MKTRFAFIAALTLAVQSPVHAQDTAAAIDDALDAYQAQDYAKCADTLTALQGRVQEMPRDSELFLVECLSAAGRTDAALAYLQKELLKGRIDPDELKSKDRPGLNKLRASPEWAPALAAAEKQIADRQAKFDHPLRKALLARYEKDQAVRLKAIDEGGGAKSWDKSIPVDKDNTAWLKKVVEEKGWPTRSGVGDDGASAAFYIAQHATLDPEFQQKVLGLIEAAVQNDEADASQFAMLKDRVLLHQGKPQIYGTQFIDNKDGSMSMQPTQDMAGLNKRRESVGLPTIEQYKLGLSELYKRQVK